MIKQKVDDETLVLEKISDMAEPLRSMGERVHRLLMNNKPTLYPRLWYGIPVYAKEKSGPAVCFFRADKYMTFGLTEHANFSSEDGDEHRLLGSSWFFSELDAATEKKLSQIISKATA
jgi:hypothetical protein